MGLELLTQQRKGTVVLNDKDARAVHGVHLLQQVEVDPGFETVA